MSVQIQVTAEVAQALKALNLLGEDGSKSLEKVAAAGKAASAGVETMSSRILENNRKLKSAIGGLALNASLFAGPQAQQFIYPLFLMQKELKGLGAAAKIAGLSLPGVGLAVAGVSALIYTGVEGWKAYKAELQLTATKASALANDLSNANRNISLLRKNAEIGRLDPREAEAMAKRLSDAEKREKLRAINPNYDDEQSVRRRQADLDFAAISAGQPLGPRIQGSETLAEAKKASDEMLKRVQLTDKELSQADELKAKQEQYNIAAMEGFEKERAAINENFRLEKIKLDELSKHLTAHDVDQVSASFVALGSSTQAQLDAVDKKEKVERAKKDAELVAEALKIQEQMDKIALDGWERQQKGIADRKQLQLQRIQNSQFLTDAEKYDQTKAAGGDLTGQADPRSFGQQMSAGLVQLQNQFGTFSQASAAFITNGIGTAIQGVSDGIMGLIDGTKAWSQVWGDVLRSMANQAIQFIVQQTAMFLLNKAKELLFHVSTETAKTTASVAGSAARGSAALGEAGAEAVNTGAKAAGSVASIPYVGWALAIAAFAGVVAMIAAASSNARALGGPVSAGQTYLVGERGPELFHAPANGGILDNRGTMKVLSGGGSKSSGSAGGGDVNVKTIVVANIQAAMEEAMASARGTKIIVQTIGGNRLDLGLDT